MKKLLATVAMATLFIAGAANAGEHKAKMEAAIAKLPAEKAEMVKETFDEMREERKALWKTHKAEREEMKSLMVAPEFNKSAFVSKAEKMAEKHKVMKVKKANRIADVATQLNQEERKILMEAMPRKGKYKHGSKKKD